MTNKYKIVLLGSGNVAYHLAEMLKRSDINVFQVYNINKESGKKLAQKYNTSFTNKISEINKTLLDIEKQIKEILEKEKEEEKFPNELILELRAGAGGDEASLFAAELANMYQIFSEKKG